MRKIELMHHLFGTKTGFCKDCGHFYRKQYGGTYRKCEVYGDSCGDWKQSEGCKMELQAAKANGLEVLYYGQVVKD